MKRASSNGGPIQIVARHYEAIQRLMQARARLALRDQPTLEDAQFAIDLLQRSFRAIAFDIGSGKIDIDLIISDVSHREREAMQMTMRVLRRLQTDGALPIAESHLLLELTRQGIADDLARQVLHKLERRGLVYQKTDGRWHLTRYFHSGVA